MKKILYVHGLGSGESSRTAHILRKNLGEEYILDAPEIPISPADALDFVSKLIESKEYDLVIASSLGAAYVLGTWSDIKRVVINPVVSPSHYVDEYVGKGIKSFTSKRKDGSTEYVIDDRFINDLKEISLCLDYESKLNTLCYVSSNDELLEGNIIECSKIFLNDNLHIIDSPHRVGEDVLLSQIIPDIRLFIEKDIEYSIPYIYGMDSGINIEED